MKITIHIFLALLFILPGTISRAQRVLDWSAFGIVMNAKPWAGKKFRVEAAVKTQCIDSTADAEVWVRVDRENKKTGFFYNMMDKPIRSKDWKVYSITGKIDKDALYLVMGGLYHRKGNFWFDDFKLFIETEKGSFSEVPVPNGSFESDSGLKNWLTGFRNVNNYKTNPVNGQAYSGKRSLLVDGSSFTNEKTFGNNDTAGHFAQVNNIRIYYETYGKGEPLLLLHGNSESAGSFYKQIPDFSKKFKVYAIDSRGQGKSTDDGRTFTYDLFADDMNALLDQLHLDSVNILGWSDGGNTGLIMAMKYPAKVKKLITMGAVIFIDNTVVDKWVFKTLNKEKKEIGDDTLFNSKMRLRLIDLLLTEPRHQFAELKTISCPVLVMAGEKDIVKENHTRGIAENIPLSTLLIAPKETHEYPWDNPKAFNKAVLDFLELK